jgi:thiol:disulfide interchange protein DsbA
MFKHVVKSILFCSGLAVATLSHAASTFTEGKHYEVVAETATTTPVVTEFFSFYCGHCFAFEPLANKLAASLPKGVKFEKNHVDFIQASPPEVQNGMARAYVVAHNAGKGTEVAGMIFNYIHQQRANFGSDADIRSLLLVNNFDPATFDNGFNSMPVLAEAIKMKQQQIYWSEKKVLTGVPMLLVNGKYKVKFDGLDEKNPEQHLIELVTYLAEKK